MTQHGGAQPAAAVVEPASGLAVDREGCEDHEGREDRGVVRMMAGIVKAEAEVAEAGEMGAWSLELGGGVAPVGFTLCKRYRYVVG
jgi:hypothetical protein